MTSPSSSSASKLFFKAVLQSCPSKLSFKAVLQSCKEYNTYLKYSKSYIGYRTAKFFGYEVSKGQYRLTPDRLAEIDKILMPICIKSILGVTVFC